MLAGFPSIRQADDDARGLVAAYIATVDEFAPWVVDQACRQWSGDARREGRTLAFPPSAAELWELCGRIAGRFIRERAKLQHALTAITYPSDGKEHARIVMGFDTLREHLAARIEDNKRRPMTPAEARAALERRCAELGVDPAEIDRVPDQPEAMRKLGKEAGRIIRGLRS